MTKRIEYIDCGHPVPTVDWHGGTGVLTGYRWPGGVGPVAFCGVCQRTRPIRSITKSKPWWRRIRVKIFLEGEPHNGADDQDSPSSR